MFLLSSFCGTTTPVMPAAASQQTLSPKQAARDTAAKKAFFAYRGAVPGRVVCVQRPSEQRALPLTHPSPDKAAFSYPRAVPGKAVCIQTPATQTVEDLSKSDLLPTQDSFESLNWKYQLLSVATQSIEFSPNFCGDLEFQTCLLKIERQMEKYPELKVHLLMSPDFLKDEELRLLNRLQAKFRSRFFPLVADRQLQMTPVAGTTENHEKLLIVDEKYFVLGGSGVKASMSTKGDQAPVVHETTGLKDMMVSTAFRDMDVVGKGALATPLRMHFFRLFQVWESKVCETDAENRHFAVDLKTACQLDALDEEPSLVRNATVRPLFSDPMSRSSVNSITLEIQSTVRGATTKVRIAHMNFNPDPLVRSALEEVRTQRPGVEIELISNPTTGDRPFGCRFFTKTNQKNYSFATAVYEFQVPQTLFHKKVTTVDGRFTIIGSYNYTTKSARLDNEVAIIVDSEEFTAQVDDVLRKDVSLSRRLTYAEQKDAQTAVSTQVLGTFQQVAFGRFL